MLAECTGDSIGVVHIHGRRSSVYHLSHDITWSCEYRRILIPKKYVLLFSTISLLRLKVLELIGTITYFTVITQTDRFD